LTGQARKYQHLSETAAQASALALLADDNVEERIYGTPLTRLPSKEVESLACSILTAATLTAA